MLIYTFNKARLVMVALACLLVFLGGCNTDMDDIIDDYNDTFASSSNTTITTVTHEPILSPGDPGFDERNMLLDEYHSHNDDMFHVAGPRNCTSYIWTIRPLHGYKDIEFVPYHTNKPIPHSGSRALTIYMPNSLIEDGEYILTLVVTGYDSKEYTDKALLNVYERMGGVN